MSGTETIRTTAAPRGIRAHPRLVAVGGAAAAVTIAVGAAVFVTWPTTHPVAPHRVVLQAPAPAAPVSPLVAEHEAAVGAAKSDAAAGLAAWGLRYQGEAEQGSAAVAPVSPLVAEHEAAAGAAKSDAAAGLAAWGLRYQGEAEQGSAAVAPVSPLVAEHEAAAGAAKSDAAQGAPISPRVAEHGAGSAAVVVSPHVAERAGRGF